MTKGRNIDPRCRIELCWMLSVCLLRSMPCEAYWRECIAFRRSRNHIFPSIAATFDSTVAFQSPIPPPPPLSLPVWSLASPIPMVIQQPSMATTTSMNIVTFATAVNVSPPKLWLLSLYHDTLTKDAFLESGRGVLQLLQPAQKDLVNILGKRTGYDPEYNKQEECKRCGFTWTSSSWMPGEGFELLPQCMAYLYLEQLSSDTTDAGDHVLVVCRVVATGEWNDNLGCVVDVPLEKTPSALDHTSVLYTGRLREEGIL